MSTIKLGGHVHTIEGVAQGRRRHRRHSAEFKAEVVAACRHPGVSIAAVALAHQLNANLLRRWVAEAGSNSRGGEPTVPAIKPAFVPVAMPPVAPTNLDITIQVQHGKTTVHVRWPVQAARECGAWLGEWLR